MTRVNCGVDPWELPRQALIAEHREITRIPNAIRRNPKIADKKLPETFRFGEGHCTFFYDKLGYLHTRYNQLYLECKRRGYNVTYKDSAFRHLPIHLLKDYSPTQADRDLTLSRLREKGHRVKGQVYKVPVPRIKKRLKYVVDCGTSTGQV